MTINQALSSLITTIFFAKSVFALPSAIEQAKSYLSDRQVSSIDIPAQYGGPYAEPLPAGFVSYSIEFSSFPDFAGNKSQPNEFSYNLLKNLKSLQGSFPYIRVGGNTQDYALYDPTLQVATNGTIIPSISLDYPRILYIGESYFDSYHTWPGVRFAHGFNLGKNGTEGRETLVRTASLACKALDREKLYYWELGNEPDLFKTSAQGIVRPANWTEADYVAEWKSGIHAAEAVFKEACPESYHFYRNKWLAPSFAGTANSLDPVETWAEGLNSEHNVALISSHNYVSGATVLGVTLQGTLMNHTRTVESVDNQVALKKELSQYDLPFILGEGNSLYNQGRPGLSNTFGAALWGIDFNLYCASQGIVRFHMHMGTNYRYQSWQPIDTANVTKGTKAPYYGNIAVAAFLGNLEQTNTKIEHVPLGGEREAAYAAYVDGKLTRLMVIDMNSYNYSVVEPVERPKSSHRFHVPAACEGQAVYNYVHANGSDAITGISFNGISYNYELDNGKPQLLSNTTSWRNVPGEVERGGWLSVEQPWASAVIVNLEC